VNIYQQKSFELLYSYYQDLSGYFTVSISKRSPVLDAQDTFMFTKQNCLTI